MDKIPQKNMGAHQSIARSSPKPIFQMVVEGSADDAELTNPAVTRTIPDSQVINTEEFQAIRLYFGGTNAEGEAFNLQVIGWVPLDPGDAKGGCVLVPIILAKGLVTLGSLVMTTLVADGFVADKLTDTIDQYGTILDSPDDNTPASIILDVRNCLVVTVETDITTAATAYVWGSPVDAPLPNADAT